MAKRTAAYQLTADNFDVDDEEKEEKSVGEFSKASDDVMARRVIKKAKKRMDGSEAASGNTVNLFSGFKTSTQNNGTPKTDSVLSDKLSVTSSSFKTTGFGVTIPGTEQSTTKPEGSSNPKDIAQKMNNQTSGNIQNSTPFKDNAAKNNKELSENGNEKEKDALYGDQIAALNMSFLNWINLHVEKNPVVDLTPVFKDYTKYINEIELKYGKSSKVEENASSVITSARAGLDDKKTMPGSSNISPVIVDKKDEAKSEVVSSPFAGFSQSKAPDAPIKANIAGFFSSAQTSTPTIQTTVSKVTGDEENKEENIEEEPCDTEKVERKVVIEEDAFYTIRCKLFFKKANDWTELGVGMLYLKSLSDGKTQLLVRMETAAGKVLLNISLHKNLPVARVGKNNVSVISIPNPPVFLKEKDGDNTKPLNYLIRVKEKEDADELLKQINDNK